MFSFFKKQNSSNDNPNKGFLNEFSKSQKVAIVSSLIIIAKSDGIHPKETEYIERIIRLLNIEADDPVFTEFAQKDKSSFMAYLNSLSKSQKQWYVVLVNGLISCDGKISQSELEFVTGFCSEIGISEDEYIQIINKTELLSKKFSI